MRFATAGVVVAAAVVGALVFTGDRTTLVDDKPPIPPVDSPDLAKLEGTIPVGDGPSGIAAGAGYIWVANRDDGTVSRINPATHDTEGVAVGGAPEDLIVANDEVWVADTTDATLHVIDASTLEVNDLGPQLVPGFSGAAPVSGHTDFAVLPYECPSDWTCPATSGEVVVTANEGEMDHPDGPMYGPAVEPNVLFNPLTPGALLGRSPGRFSDVFVSDGFVWAMAPAGRCLQDSVCDVEGQLLVLDPFKANPFVATEAIPSTTRGDLVAEGNDAWVSLSDQGIIRHIKDVCIPTDDSDLCRETSAESRMQVRLSGVQFGLALGEGSLWVVSTQGDAGPGAVIRVDPQTMQVVEEAAIEGNPVDLVVGGGSVWVVDALNDVVLRFEADEFVPAPEESP